MRLRRASPSRIHLGGHIVMAQEGGAPMKTWAEEKKVGVPILEETARETFFAPLSRPIGVDLREEPEP